MRRAPPRSSSPPRRPTPRRFAAPRRPRPTGTFRPRARRSYSPEPGNECNKAARACLTAFEVAFDPNSVHAAAAEAAENDAKAEAAKAKAAAKAAAPKAAPKTKKAKADPYEGMEPLAKCSALLAALQKRKTSEWFLKPVDFADAPDYKDYVSTPMDYGTIAGKLEASGYASPEAFAADVRLVTSNAITYSPEVTNACHKAARANLTKFEKDFVDAGLATDGGAAAAAAAAAEKDALKAAAPTRKRKSSG